MNFFNNRNSFLFGALSRLFQSNFLIKIFSYLESLLYDSKHDHTVFRIYSIWSVSSEIMKVNEIILKYLTSLKSTIYKFVPLIYQLSARISSKNDTFKFQLALQVTIYFLAIIFIEYYTLHCNRSPFSTLIPIVCAYKCENRSQCK